MIIQNVGNYVRDNTASYPTKTEYSATLLSEPRTPTANGIQCPSILPPYFVPWS
jgi:hypothetical protein